MLYKNCIHFYIHLKLYSSFHLKVIFTHHYFHFILQLIYQLSFFYTYSFYNLNILQHHMIYHIHIHSYLDSKSILCQIFLCQSILCIHICIYLHSIFVNYYKLLHLVYLCTYKFHAILCNLVSSALEIRLNTLIFMFLLI